MYQLKPLVKAVRYAIYYQLVNQLKKENNHVT